MTDREQRLRKRIDTLVQQRATLRDQLWAARTELRKRQRRITTLTHQRDNWRDRALRHGL